MKLTFGDDLAQGTQRLLDPADNSALAKGKVVWPPGPWLERQMERPRTCSA
jgi:hypothetical protein